MYIFYFSGLIMKINLSFFFSSLYFLIIETNKLYEQIVFEEIRKNFSRFDFRWKTTLDNSQY